MNKLPCAHTLYTWLQVPSLYAQILVGGSFGWLYYILFASHQCHQSDNNMLLLYNKSWFTLAFLPTQTLPLAS